MKIDHPLSQVKQPIQVVLRALAAQEGCDGEPFNEMQLAAEYIDRLESCITKLIQKHEEDLVHIVVKSSTDFNYSNEIINNLKAIIE